MPESKEVTHTELTSDTSMGATGMARVATVSSIPAITASPALLAVVRALGRDAARRQMARRGFSFIEMIVGLLITSALVALALALRGQ